MVASIIACLGLVAAATANPPGWPHHGPGGPGGWPPHGQPSGEEWGLKKFTTLVAFGDSYTDDSRLNYFSEHNGTAPPVGWVDPVASQSKKLQQRTYPNL